MRFHSQIEGLDGPALIERMIEKNGPLLGANRVPEEVIARFDARLPDLLLDVWADPGVGFLQRQHLALCVPGELRAVIEKLFYLDPDFGPPPDRDDLRATDCHAIAYSAFGKILVWSERHQLILVDTQLGLVDAPFRQGPAADPNTLIVRYVFGMPPEALDAADDSGNPMYAAAEDALGPLDPGQIYGSQPAASFGDPVSVEHLARVPAADWLFERIASRDFRLADFARGEFDLRGIGPVVGGARP